MESAPRDERRNIAAAEAQRGVRRERRLSQPVWLVAVRVNRVRRPHDRAVVPVAIIREWESEDFVDPDARALKAAVDTLHKTGGVTVFRSRPGDRGLLHRAANLAPARELGRVHHPAPKFIHRTGAARHITRQTNRRDTHQEILHNNSFNKISHGPASLSSAKLHSRNFSLFAPAKGALMAPEYLGALMVELADTLL